MKIFVYLFPSILFSFFLSLYTTHQPNNFLFVGNVLSQRHQPFTNPVKKMMHTYIQHKVFQVHSAFQSVGEKWLKNEDGSVQVCHVKDHIKALCTVISELDWNVALFHSAADEIISSLDGAFQLQLDSAYKIKVLKNIIAMKNVLFAVCIQPQLNVLDSFDDLKNKLDYYRDQFSGDLVADELIGRGVILSDSIVKKEELCKNLIDGFKFELARIKKEEQRALEEPEYYRVGLTSLLSHWQNTKNCDEKEIKSYYDSLYRCCKKSSFDMKFELDQSIKFDQKELNFILHRLCCFERLKRLSASNYNSVFYSAILSLIAVKKNQGSWFQNFRKKIVSYDFFKSVRKSLGTTLERMINGLGDAETTIRHVQSKAVIQGNKWKKLGKKQAFNNLPEFVRGYLFDHFIGSRELIGQSFLDMGNVLGDSAQQCAMWKQECMEMKIDVYMNMLTPEAKKDLIMEIAQTNSRVLDVTNSKKSVSFLDLLLFDRHCGQHTGWGKNQMSDFCKRLRNIAQSGVDGANELSSVVNLLESIAALSNISNQIFFKQVAPSESFDEKLSEVWYLFLRKYHELLANSLGKLINKVDVLIDENTNEFLQVDADLKKFGQCICCVKKSVKQEIIDLEKVLYFYKKKWSWYRIDRWLEHFTRTHFVASNEYYESMIKKLDDVRKKHEHVNEIEQKVSRYSSLLGALQKIESVKFDLERIMAYL